MKDSQNINELTKELLGGNLLNNTFSNLQEKGEKALITYITAGDPSLEDTTKLVLSIAEAGVDVIELGIPYSDPVADGPVIQQASLRALQAGTTLDGIMQVVAQLRPQTRVPLVLMTYINPILQYGVERFMAIAYQSGVNGLIIPDLPVEEVGLIEQAAVTNQIALVPLVAPTSPSSRIEQICAKGQGFVYCVSLTGVTGMRTGLAANIDEFLVKVRAATKLPMAVGFGISTPEQIINLKEKCDGVVVGSAIVNLINQAGTSPEGLVSLQSYIRTLKEAAR